MVQLRIRERIARWWIVRRSPRTWAPPFNTLIAIAALVISIGSLYCDKVYVLHRLTASVLDESTAEGRLRVTILFSNGGNRTVAVVSVRPTIPVGTAVRRGRAVIEESTPLPLAVAPGEVKTYTVVTTYDIQKAWESFEGTPIAPDRRTLPMFLSLTAVDSHGDHHLSDFELIRYEIGPDGPIRGLGVGMLQPRLVVNTRRLIGPW